MSFPPLAAQDDPALVAKARSDFDGGGGGDGYSNAAESINVTIELVRRWYSERDIAKVWGGNVLRVMGQVETAAKKAA